MHRINEYALKLMIWTGINDYAWNRWICMILTGIDEYAWN